MECPICYTEITPNVNYTVTLCKHTFCMNCFISSVLRNNLCPCCRTELYQNDIDSNESNTIYSEDEYPYHDNTQYNDDYPENDYLEENDNNDDEYDDEDPFAFATVNDGEPIASIEEICRQVQEKGITMVDLIHLIIPGRYPKNYTDCSGNALYNKIYKVLTDTIERADFDTKLEYYETQIMEKEDCRIE